MPRPQSVSSFPRVGWCRYNRQLWFCFSYDCWPVSSLIAQASSSSLATRGGLHSPPRAFLGGSGGHSHCRWFLHFRRLRLACAEVQGLLGWHRMWRLDRERNTWVGQWRQPLVAKEEGAWATQLESSWLLWGQAHTELQAGAESEESPRRKFQNHSALCHGPKLLPVVWREGTGGLHGATMHPLSLKHSSSLPRRGLIVLDTDRSKELVSLIWDNRKPMSRDNWSSWSTKITAFLIFCRASTLQKEIA